MDWTVVMTDEGWVRVTTEGTFDVTDYERMVADILSRPFWKPGTSALFDHRQLSTAGTSFEGILDTAASHDDTEPLIGDGCIALLVASAHTYGRARQFAQFVGRTSSMRIRVFQAEDEALEWVRGD